MSILDAWKWIRHEKEIKKISNGKGDDSGNTFPVDVVGVCDDDPERDGGPCAG